MPVKLSVGVAASLNATPTFQNGPVAIVAPMSGLLDVTVKVCGSVAPAVASSGTVVPWSAGTATSEMGCKDAVNICAMFQSVEPGLTRQPPRWASLCGASASGRPGAASAFTVPHNTPSLAHGFRRRIRSKSTIRPTHRDGHPDRPSLVATCSRQQSPCRVAELGFEDMREIGQNPGEAAGFRSGCGEDTMIWVS